MPTSIDHHALQAIRALQRPGKPDLLARVIGLFETETPKSLASLHAGVDSDDLEVVRNAAHSLKSSCAYVGATELSERCRDIERAARAGSFPECLVLADGLDELFADSLQQLLCELPKAA